MASGGRLVVARRPMLVKRKDLPPVEIRSDYGASLEERLRALTTIEEEDPSSSGSAAQHSSVSYPNGQSLTLPLRGEGRPDSSRDPARNADDRDLARAESGSGRVEEDLGYEEGLYCVMDKKQQPVRRTSAPLLRRTLPGSGSVRSMDSQPMREGERTFGGKPLAGPEDRPGNAPSLHRAVPIRGEPEGVSCYPSRTDDPGVSFGDQGHPAQRSAGGVSAARSQEVRFKAGGGGVKLNADSGRFEIDYSYYMKATPSESNDEVNTYSPDHTRADLEADVFDEPGEESAFHPQPGPPGWDRGPGGDGVIVIRDPRQRVGVEEGYYGGGGGGRTGSNAESGRVLRGGVGGEVGLRQGGVMSSMPNLSFPQPAGTRRSSATHDVYRHALPRRCSGEADLYGADGGSGRPASQQQQPHAGTHQADGPDSSARLPFPGPQPGYAPLSRDRRHPAPSSGYPVPGGRSAGQGDRNSCDAGSLYRRADRSQTFPPSQGLAADRLSLNLGDLPRIHEQLRATSEMLLSAGKRHQFASSSDIYKLFQGQQQQRQQQLAAGFSQGRQPPQRHSFHAFSSGQPPSQNLTDVRPCASRAGSGGQASRGSGDPPHGQTTPAGPHPPSPLRADRSIVGPENAGYSPYSGGGRDARSVYGRDVGSLSHADAGLSPRDVSLSPRDVAAYQAQLGHRQRGDPRSVPQVPGRDPAQGGRVTPSFRQRLSKGEQFATDLIQDPDGEKLSTLV